jgi:hypothetical protein
MTNATITKEFLSTTDAETQASVINAIAKHYGCSQDEAFAEITDKDAEHLLDYLTEPVRSAIHLIMKRHGLA